MGGKSALGQAFPTLPKPQSAFDEEIGTGGNEEISVAYGHAGYSADIGTLGRNEVKADSKAFGIQSINTENGIVNHQSVSVDCRLPHIHRQAMSFFKKNTAKTYGRGWIGDVKAFQSISAAECRIIPINAIDDSPGVLPRCSVQNTVLDEHSVAASPEWDL